jgi:protease secretion system membrane fusion protein
MANIIKKTAEPVAEVISHDVAPLTVNTDAGAYANVGWIIVLVGVIGFLLWASVAPLDKGVPMSGFVAKEGNRKAIQYLTGGVVQEILVHDGDKVKAGQVLVRMNDVQASANMQTTMAQYIVSRSAETRLTAELQGAKSVAFPEELNEYKDDPRVKENVALQRDLFTSRQLSLNSELGAVDENIAGVTAQMKGLEESRESKKAQLGFLKEQLENSRDLAKEGYIPRSRLLDLERTFAQINGAISEDVGNIARAHRQIAELKLRRMQRSQDFQKEVRSQLAEAHKEAEALSSRLPVDGVVVGSSIFTKGGVVTPGSKLMEVVPSDDALVVEGQLPVNLVDKVHHGLQVELIFAAFNTNKTPHIPGQIIQVAADRTVDERTGNSFYKVRAKVTPEGAKLIAEKKLEIVPGMPVELFVKTGERTMMSYLLKPIFDRVKTSMTEE